MLPWHPDIRLHVELRRLGRGRPRPGQGLPALEIVETRRCLRCPPRQPRPLATAPEVTTSEELRLKQRGARISGRADTHSISVARGWLSLRLHADVSSNSRSDTSTSESALSSDRLAEATLSLSLSPCVARSSTWHPAAAGARAASSSSLIWMRLASSMEGPSRWVWMVRMRPGRRRRTAKRGLALGVVVLERRRLLPGLVVLELEWGPLLAGRGYCSCTLERRLWVRAEDGRPTLERRRARLVATATLGRRSRPNSSSASSPGFLLK